MFTLLRDALGDRGLDIRPQGPRSLRVNLTLVDHDPVATYGDHLAFARQGLQTALNRAVRAALADSGERASLARSDDVRGLGQRLAALDDARPELEARVESARRAWEAFGPIVQR